jgi:regulator of sigma E protease
MLPLPILDGGHIVLAIGEFLAGRPIKARLLEVVQFAFFFLLIGLFLFITTKDIGDSFGGGPKGPEKLEWPTEGS